MRHGVERKSRSGAGPVLDHNLLAPSLRQTISNDAGCQIRSAARRKTDKEPTTRDG